MCYASIKARALGCTNGMKKSDCKHKDEVKEGSIGTTNLWG